MSEKIIQLNEMVTKNENKESVHTCITIQKMSSQDHQKPDTLFTV